MNDLILSYLNEKQITPEILSLINVLVQMGGSSPSHYIAYDYPCEILSADTEGYITTEDNRIYLTKKAELFLRTFFMLSKQEGLL